MPPRHTFSSLGTGILRSVTCTKPRSRGLSYSPPTPRRLLPPAARPRPSGVALEAVRPARPRVMCIVPASDLPEKGPGVELKINILFRDARLWPLYPFIYLLCNRPD